MQTLKSIREKIAKLELEKAELQAELEELKEKAETRADSLEDEVAPVSYTHLTLPTTPYV